MHRSAWFVGLSLLGSVSGCAGPVQVGSAVVVDLPGGWHIQKEVKGAFDALYASPNKDMAPPVIGVQACRRSKPGCSVPCESTAIQRYFFFSFLGPDKFTFRESQRADGSRIYFSRGTVGEGSSSAYIAQYVLCSAVGLVQIDLMQQRDDEALIRQLISVAETLRWEP